MKKNINTSTNIINIIEEPIWKSYDKFFEYIRIYFNDQLIEELNEDIFNINYNLYCDKNKQNQLLNITKIIKNNEYYELYIPLIFWFCNKSTLALPTLSLPYIDIKLNYKLNNLKYILSNDLSDNYYFDNINPTIKIDLISDIILLNINERNLFSSFNHEYIIERYITFPSSYIYDSNFTIDKKFSGLIKDIYIIAKDIYNNLLYKLLYDSKYEKYLITLNYHNIFINNNYIYTSDEQKNYSLDIQIIINNIIEYNKGSFRITYLSNLLPSFDIMYLLYYIDKYLFIYQFNKQIYLLLLYIKNDFYIKKELISPIDSILFKINGTDLFTVQSNIYYNTLIPSEKFYNSISPNLYIYSFSLDPLNEQPSGHLNFTHFEDTSIIITSSINQSFKVNISIKEYNILRVVSGIGSLAWLN